MELFLQFGYGMMDHSRNLIKSWGGGTTILSPRDLTSKQLQKLAKELRQLGGNVVVDPQFYLPHADHGRLNSHDYWPPEYKTSGFWTGKEIRSFVSKLLVLNRDLNCNEFFLPGLLATTVDDDWLERQGLFISEANALDTTGLPLIATVALGEDATRDNEQIHRILEAAERWDVDGIYLVCEHPRGEYLGRALSCGKVVVAAGSDGKGGGEGGGDDAAVCLAR